MVKMIDLENNGFFQIPFIKEYRVGANFVESQEFELYHNFIQYIPSFIPGLYLYFNTKDHDVESREQSPLEVYVEFLDKYQYPEEQLSLIALKMDSENLVMFPEILEMKKNISKDPLRYALEHEYSVMLKYLMSTGVYDKIASKYGHLDALKDLTSPSQYWKVVLDRIRSEVKSQQNKFITLALDNGSLEMVQYLVSLGANIQADNNWAISLASSRGNLEMVRYLVSLGANIRTNNNNWAITSASALGYLNIVEYLVSIGADVDSAIEAASSRGSLEVIKYLVSIGANKNLGVSFASKYGHLEAVKYLVSIGADIRENNNMALAFAAENGLLEMVEYLVSLGADPGLNGGIGGMGAIELALSHSYLR